MKIPCSQTYSWGEFFDRLTIINRKTLFDPDNYNHKLKEFESILTKVEMDYELLLLVASLQMTNTDIWNLESDLRKGQEGKLGFEEIGRRALEIRNINSRRVDLVNKINE